MFNTNDIAKRNAASNAIFINTLPNGTWDVYVKDDIVPNGLNAADIVSDNIIIISAWQLRKALTAAGLRAAVEAAVANSGNQDLKDDYEYRTEFHSDNQLVLTVGAAVGQDAAGVRALFELGATL